MTTTGECRHLELYYSTKHGDVVEWLCPSCRSVVNLGPVNCSHLGVNLREAQGSAESVYRCVVSGCLSSYPLPDTS